MIEVYNVMFTDDVRNMKNKITLKIELNGYYNINYFIASCNRQGTYFAHGDKNEVDSFFKALNSLVKDNRVSVAELNDNEIDLCFDVYGKYKTKDGRVYSARIKPFVKEVPCEFKKYVDKLISFVYNGGTKAGQPRVIRVKSVESNKKYLDGVDVFEGETGESRRYSFDKIDKKTIKELA